VDRDALDRAIGQFADSSHTLTKHLLETNERVGVSFPSGFIRQIRTIQKRWPYLDQKVSHTLACVVQLSDVNRWHLSVWNVGLTAGTMWDWHCAVPVIAIIESLLIEYGVLQQWLTRDTKFKKVINVLHSRGVFDHLHQAELHELRDYRNELHLFLKRRVRRSDGSLKQHDRAVLALKFTEERLLEHWQAQSRAA